MRVNWYEQSQYDVRPGSDWLSEWEESHLQSLRIPKRRADWLLGRWTAKHAVADYLRLPASPSALTTVEIRPHKNGAPEVFVRGLLAEVAISLSHRSGLGACAVAERAVKFGCDLEVVEPHSDEFVADYFTSEEQREVEMTPIAERFRAIALIWSAKESVLKALRVGAALGDAGGFDPTCSGINVRSARP